MEKTIKNMHWIDKCRSCESQYYSESGIPICEFHHTTIEEKQNCEDHRSKIQNNRSK
jgi:hypothetical protein